MQRPEHAPVDLAGDLVCTWRATMSGTDLLVPDGCVDVLWILGAEQLWICGPERGSWTPAVPAGTSAVGVRLRPGVARHLLRTDVHHLADRRIRSADCFPSGHDRRLRQRLLDAADPLAVLVDEVRGWSGRAERLASDEAIVRAATAPRPGTVGQVAAAMDLTPRQIHRRSTRLFGYGYSTVVQMLRFQRFLHLARARADLSLAEAAAIAGYSDHAHLVRHCRSITGRTPTDLLAATRPTFPAAMSDPFKTPATVPA